jgi:HAD superfamily hydrolase (TIGR01549 family)
MINAIIFDFDGVITESVDVKTSAFKELFKEYPQSIPVIEKFHLDNGGMSRYDKFRHIYSAFLKLELTSSKFNQLCNDFHSLVIDKVVEAPYVAGALDTLDFCLGKYPMFIVSGTPEDEMNEIVRRRGLSKYFIEVYGSPASKTVLINRIMAEKKYSAEEILFIGDSRNDLKAAVDTKVNFVARVVDYTQEWFKSRDVKKYFSDLKGFKKYIEDKQRRHL